MITSPTAPKAPSPHTFGVSTRIARAAGKNGRYTSGAIRALPTDQRDLVVLQATDGHQATCVLCPGEMATARLVPVGVLREYRESLGRGHPITPPNLRRLFERHWHRACRAQPELAPTIPASAIRDAVEKLVRSMPPSIRGPRS